MCRGPRARLALPQWGTSLSGLTFCLLGRTMPRVPLPLALGEAEWSLEIGSHFGGGTQTGTSGVWRGRRSCLHVETRLVPPQRL